MKELEAIQLTAGQWEQMREDVERRAPEEACGLLSGQDDRVHEVFPMTNALNSPVRFRLDPQEQIQAFEHIEQNGWELVGIYHSHPQGPPTPSRTDVMEAYYPEAVNLIWSRQAGDWSCRGFRIKEGLVSEVTIFINGKSNS
jgi:proteasome lid subunit RPN8/RPN11